MNASLAPDQATEVEFISGVSAGGLVSARSFDTWNSDSPASYSAARSFEAKWGAAIAGSPGGVTYAFDVASNWTAKEQAAFTATMHLWAAESGIAFAPGASGASADVLITRGADGSANGGIIRLYEGAVGTTQLGQALKGEISIDTSVAGFGPVGGSFSSYGGYPWTVLLHEEGHVLGLGHAGAYDDGTTTSTPQLTSFDSRAWSLMSYIDSNDPAVEQAASTPPGGFHWGLSAGDNGYRYYDTPTTPMLLDIAAAQRLYGLPSSTPLSGGETFGFNCNVAGDIEPFFDFSKNSKPVVTLWDEGSGNTLDLSGFASGSTVDLHDGAFSSCAGLTNNLAIALGVRIDMLVTGSGADHIQANADGDVILGGAGDDTILGGANQVGTMEMLFGNKGRDVLSSSSPGSVELFGGQDGDAITLTSSGRGVTHFAFGNLGDDTLSASGGFNSLYGGQGNDIVSAAGDSVGHNYVSGDLGDDSLTASSGGADTLRGGGGMDTLILTSHPLNASDTILVGAGESTASPSANEINLDHIYGFSFSVDHVVIIGHAAGAAGNVTISTDAAVNSSESAAFSSAYLYAYGDGSAAHVAHVGASGYLAVAESYGAATAVYVLTADHTAVAFVGATEGSFQPQAIIAG